MLRWGRLVLSFAFAVAAGCGASGPGDGDGTPGTVDDLDGDGDGSGGDGDECAQVESVQPAVGRAPDLLLVVDKSGSMDDPLGTGDNKWDVMRSALSATVTEYGGVIDFGLQLFPRGSLCSAGDVSESVGPDTADDIVRALDRVFPDGGTPTDVTLARTRAFFAGRPANPAGRYVLLATDGQPNCGSLIDPLVPTVNESVDAIESLTAAGIRTFVLGFGDGGINNFPDVLQAMAEAGDTGVAYSAQSPDELAAALDAIAAEVGTPSCTFGLDVTPSDASVIGVSVDGAPIPRDPGREDGWDYDAASNTITFYGPPCDDIRAGSAGEVRMEIDCVPVIE